MFSYRNVKHAHRFGISQLDSVGYSVFIRGSGSSETFVKIGECFQLWILARAMTAQIAADLSYPADTLLLYQAAYAVATSNAFTADGSDGHFAWCIRQLARADITAVLLA